MATTNVELKDITEVKYNHNGVDTDITEVWYCCTNNATCCKIWPAREPTPSRISLSTKALHDTSNHASCTQWPSDQDQFTTVSQGEVCYTKFNYDLGITYTRPASCGAYGQTSFTITAAGKVCAEFHACYYLTCGIAPSKIVIKPSGVCYRTVFICGNVSNLSSCLKQLRVMGSPRWDVNDIPDTILTAPGVEVCTFFDEHEAGTFQVAPSTFSIVPAYSWNSSVYICEYQKFPFYLDESSSTVDVYLYNENDEVVATCMNMSLNTRTHNIDYTI